MKISNIWVKIWLCLTLIWLFFKAFTIFILSSSCWKDQKHDKHNNYTISKNDLPFKIFSKKKNKNHQNNCQCYVTFSFRFYKTTKPCMIFIDWCLKFTVFKCAVKNVCCIKLIVECLLVCNLKGLYSKLFFLYKKQPNKS